MPGESSEVAAIDRVPELDEVLDRVLVPRRNGSAGLEQVADWLEETLSGVAPEVERFVFRATPHGFEIVWGVALALMLAWAACWWTGRARAALALALLTPALLLLEFEAMLSPLSGWLSAQESHVLARFPGRAGSAGPAPTLTFTAHYDSATHLGDHFVWAFWGWCLGPAVALAVAAPLAAARLRRRGRPAGPGVRIAVAALVLAPFGAMAGFHALGPHWQTPSPGALDNGGAVAALVRLAGRLAERPPDRAVTVELVFLAAEEERALGSWLWARSLVSAPARGGGRGVVNLEVVGASDDAVWITEDGFALRRWYTPPAWAAYVDAAAVDRRGAGLARLELPRATLTDGRSFLAHGIPAITLASREAGGFPRGLHSARDGRGRLSPAAIERTVDLLEAIVARAAADPEALRLRLE